MKKILFAAAVLLVSIPAFAAEKAAAKAAPASKDDAIKAVFEKVDAAFAKHDAKAFGDLFTADSTFVAPMGDGAVIKGKADIVKSHEQMMNDPAMKDVTSKHTVENVRWINANTALADLSVEFTGMKMPEGAPANMPAPKWHATVLLTNKGGHWMLQDVRPYTIMPMPQQPEHG